MVKSMKPIFNRFKINFCNRSICVNKSVFSATIKLLAMGILLMMATLDTALILAMIFPLFIYFVLSAAARGREQ